MIENIFQSLFNKIKLIKLYNIKDKYSNYLPKNINRIELKFEEF